MDAGTVVPSAPQHSSLQWLVRLRWISLFGLAVCVAFANSEGQSLQWPLLGVIIGTGVASNAVLAVWARQERQQRADASFTPSWVISSALLLDMLLLTGCLALTGGASNPFSVLYLVHIALAAVVLTGRQTLAIAAASVVCFALLFLVDVGPVHVHDPRASLFENKHLQGMWLAFTLAALITGYFVSRIAATIQAQRAQIAALRETAQRHARLASLTTLAAGAAHELSTPLGTIAVAAYEMQARGGRHADAEAGSSDIGDAADLGLILAEVDRCQQIIRQLAPRSRENEPPSAISPQDLARQLRARMGGDADRLAFEGAFSALHAPPSVVHTALAAIVHNALTASPPHATVRIVLAERPNEIEIKVVDLGQGMTPEVARRVGEPFFTTKEPGSGMGLGVFLAQTSMQTLGGALTLESTPGRGTNVVLSFPV